MAKIFVVEDNPDYRELLQTFLESAGHVITTANDGKEALTILSNNSFDLVLLDLMLPIFDGYKVCKEIRSTKQIPIIMLTALDSEANQTKGYDLQIDDYITKPVSMSILIRKVEAILRRTKVNDVETFRFHNIFLDTGSHTVKINDKEISFTLLEFRILQELMKNQHKVVRRKYLIEKLWVNDEYGDPRILDTHIKNIRRKLGCVNYIETVRGVGYRLRKEDV